MGEVLLQGDINARIGTKPDFISKDKFDDTFGITNQKITPHETLRTKRSVKGDPYS